MTMLISFPGPNLKWKELPGTSGLVQYANVRGDVLGDGPYEAFLSVRAGTEHGPRLHSVDLTVVVLGGTYYVVDHGKLTEHPAGSYFHVPAGHPYESGARPGRDCLIFQQQPAGFDLTPA
ncbi:hypothetical protein ABZZ17_30600 [Streptomyces sp. NPDC006512]|uniref:hypothetical protein n=1 Tax=Streptomyces sp. NPDC006512 TaxID=3154307 RepID=UPI0033BA4D01